MGVKVSNNAFGTISAGINSSATTVTLDSGQGARFPTLGGSDHFYGTLIDTNNNVEIIKVTARSTDSMTVVRAQDNTTAQAFAIGDRFELRPTAALFEDILSEALVVPDDAVTLAKMASGTDGNLISYDTSGNPVAVATGSSGQVLTSAGAGAVPSFQAAAGGGKILQVQHTNSTTFINTTSTSYQTLVSVDITPSATSSKILLFGSCGEPDQTDGRLAAHMYRDGTSISSGSNDGGRLVSEMGRGLSNTGAETHRATVSQMMVDSPSSTSQITYSVKIKSQTGGTVRVGNGGSSNIIAMEIGA